MNKQLLKAVRFVSHTADTDIFSRELLIEVVQVLILDDFNFQCVLIKELRFYGKARWQLVERLFEVEIRSRFQRWGNRKSSRSMVPRPAYSNAMTPRAASTIRAASGR